MLYRLHPYYENFGKRVIKSPKVYFCDVGLICYLIGIDDLRQVENERLRGALFENMVIIDLIKIKSNQGRDPQIYYFRDNHQNEVDAVIKHRDYLIPIEIKSTATFNKVLLKGLKYYKQLAGERCPFGFLVYSGEQEQQLGDHHLINFRNLAQIYEMIEALP